MSRPAPGPTQPLFSGYQGSFSGESWQGCGADHTSLHTCSTNFMNAWSCNSIPLYAETTLLTLTYKYRDGLTFGETYIHTYIHYITCIHTYSYKQTYIHTYIHTYTHTHIDTYRQIDIHMYTHTYVHTYIRVHTVDPQVCHKDSRMWNKS